MHSFMYNWMSPNVNGLGPISVKSFYGVEFIFVFKSEQAVRTESDGGIWLVSAQDFLCLALVQTYLVYSTQQPT